MTVSALFLRGRFYPPTPALALACIAFALLVRPVAAEQNANILAQAFSGPLRCEIQRDDKDGMIELIGIAEGARPLAGHSSFVVTKSGSSGSSKIDQGEHFSVKLDEQAVVGRANLNLDSGGRVTVDLRLRSDDGIECRAQASLER